MLTGKVLSAERDHKTSKQLFEKKIQDLNEKKTRREGQKLSLEHSDGGEGRRQRLRGGAYERTMVREGVAQFEPATLSSSSDQGRKSNRGFTVRIFSVMICRSGFFYFQHQSLGI